MTAKILTIDIETAPTLAYVWRLFDQNVGLNQVVKPTYILSWAAKWLGEKKIHYDGISNHTKGKCTERFEGKMVKGMWELLDEADIVVGHNSIGFDHKYLNSAFIRAKLDPPSNFRKVDTLRIAKANTKFLSNKLEHLVYTLGLDHKMHNEGFELWTKCMAGDKAAWRRMEAYNIQDVLILEDVYIKMRAWDKRHPNMALYYEDDKVRCTVCGSTNHQTLTKRARTAVSIFAAYRCKSCGHIMRDASREKVYKEIMRNAQ